MHYWVRNVVPSLVLVLFKTASCYATQVVPNGNNRTLLKVNKTRDLDNIRFTKRDIQTTEHGMESNKVSLNFARFLKDPPHTQD